MPCNPFVRAKWREAWTHREPERDKPALPWGTVGPAPKVHILDRKDFDGGIVADVEDAMRFIERNTRTAYRIEGLRRQNVPEYPMEAVREAITNAVMHHDWFFDGANVEPSTRAAPQARRTRAACRHRCSTFTRVARAIGRVCKTTRQAPFARVGGIIQRRRMHGAGALK